MEVLFSGCGGKEKNKSVREYRKDNLYLKRGRREQKSAAES